MADLAAGELAASTPSAGNSVRQEPDARSWLAERHSDAQWASTHFAPWWGRKLRGRSAGDFVDPKLPKLTAISAIPRARTTADRRPPTYRQQADQHLEFRPRRLIAPVLDGNGHVVVRRTKDSRAQTKDCRVVKGPAHRPR